MAKITDIIAAGGVLPALASGVAGKENRGFGLGILPGLLYKDRYRKKNAAGQEVPMTPEEQATTASGMKKGGKVKKMAQGGSASKRADGIAQRGKTRGKMV